MSEEKQPENSNRPIGMNQKQQLDISCPNSSPNSLSGCWNWSSKNSHFI